MERRFEWTQDGEEAGLNPGCRVEGLTRATGGVLTFGAAMLASDRGKATFVQASAFLPGAPLLVRLIGWVGGQRI